jgi:hypothetical protein
MRRNWISKTGYKYLSPGRASNVERLNKDRHVTPGRRSPEFASASWTFVHTLLISNVSIVVSKGTRHSKNSKEKIQLKVRSKAVATTRASEVKSRDEHHEQKKKAEVHTHQREGKKGRRRKRRGRIRRSCHCEAPNMRRTAERMKPRQPFSRV